MGQVAALTRLGRRLETVLSIFDLSGRTSRAGFWTLYLGYGIYFLGLATVFSPHRQGAEIITAWLPAALLIVFAVIRRLHDRGRSAWWALVFFGAPLLVFPPILLLDEFRRAGAIGETFFFFAGMSFAVLASVPMWWGFVEVGFLRGTRGPNRYGPDPLLQ